MKPALALLLLAGLAVALGRVPASGAIQQASLDRGQQAGVADDDGTGAVTLTDSYSAVGTVTNRFQVGVAISLTADPRVDQACWAVTGEGQCSDGDWELYLCLATDLTSAGTAACQAGGGGQASERSFSGTGAADPQGATTAGLTAGTDGTLHLLARLVLQQQDGTARFCGEAGFTVSVAGNLAGTIADGGIDRRQVYRLGSGCP